MTIERCLFLGCSGTKTPDESELPAIDRYDGPLFRVLRRCLRELATECPTNGTVPDIYILSAEFGLIPGYRPIPNYNRRMTTQRARELHPQVLAELERIFKDTKDYQELLICMGQDYFQVLHGWKMLIPAELSVKVSTGTLGKMQSELYDWLHGGPPSALFGSPHGKVRIRGIEIDLTPQQALDLARRALAQGRGDSNRYQSWFVQIDEQRVAPKWLVSQITGLPASTFATSEARRFLTQLGIKVMRV